MTTMLVAIAALSVGYFLGGYLGDFYFERTPRGRAIVGAMGVLASAVFLLLTLNVPVENAGLFTVLLGFTGVTMSITAPNAMVTVPDITPPETRLVMAALQSMDGSGVTIEMEEIPDARI